MSSGAGYFANVRQPLRTRVPEGGERKGECVRCCVSLQECHHTTSQKTYCTEGCGGQCSCEKQVLLGRHFQLPGPACEKAATSICILISKMWKGGAGSATACNVANLCKSLMTQPHRQPTVPTGAGGQCSSEKQVLLGRRFPLPRPACEKAANSVCILVSKEWKG